MQMVVRSNKHSQRYLVPVRSVCSVKRGDVSEVSVFRVAACVAPEDVFYNVVIIQLYVIVKLVVLRPTLLEESYQLVHIVDVISVHIRNLPGLVSTMDGN